MINRLASLINYWRHSEIISRMSIPPPELYPEFDDTSSIVRFIQNRGEIAKHHLIEGNYKEALTQYSLVFHCLTNFYLDNNLQEYNAWKTLSNSSLCFLKMGQYQDALVCAKSCILKAPYWPKGYWRMATVLQSLNQLTDAYNVFIDGFFNTDDTSDDIKQNFLYESVCLLHQIDEHETRPCYEMLKRVEKKWWEPLLIRLGKHVQWWGIGYLMIGPDLKELNDSEYDLLANGVAIDTSTEYVPLKTLFDFLSVENPKTVARWLDPLVIMMLVYSPRPASFSSLCADIEDIPFHAAVRFSLMIGRTSLLKYFMSHISKEKHIILGQESVAENGDTVFHVIAKSRPLPEYEILINVIGILLRAGHNAALKNNEGKLPVDCLDMTYDGEIFDIFLKACCKITSDDIPFWKEEGNSRFQSGDYRCALEMYNFAIKIFEDFGSEVPKAMTKRDISALYGKRSAVLLSQNRFPEAYDDATKSVLYDGLWYKSHLRVGRALRGLGNLDVSMRALINALTCEKNLKDKTLVQILMDVAQTYRLMARHKFLLTVRISANPNTYELLWYRAAYHLIENGQWDEAHVAYLQACMKISMEANFPVSLKTLCNIDKAKSYPWVMQVIHYFVLCQSNHQDISFYPGDTYFHAVAYLTIKAGSSKNQKSLSLLRYILNSFVIPMNEQDLLDKDGNTVLHVVLREPCKDEKLRFEIMNLLADVPVNPLLTNLDGKTVRDVAYDIPSVKAYLIFIEESYHEKLEKNRMQSKCNKCNQLIEKGELDFKNEQLYDGYQKLVLVLEAEHTKYVNQNVAVDRVIAFIVNKLGETQTPEIPDSVISMSETMCDRVTKELIKAKKWRQTASIVQQYRNKNGTDTMKCFAESVDIVELVRDKSFKTDANVLLQIIQLMLNSGASLGKDGGVELLQAAKNEGHFKVVAELLKRGVDPSALSFAAGDTPIHAALVVGLEKDKGNFTLFVELMKMFYSDQKKFACFDPSQVDANRDSLFHLLARCKVNDKVITVIEILCARSLSTSVRNTDGKRPIDYIIRNNDRRKQFFQLNASDELSQKESSSSKIYNKRNTVSNDEKVVDETKRTISELDEASTKREALKRKIEGMIRLLDERNISAFDLLECRPSTSATIQERTEANMSSKSPQNSCIKVKDLSASTDAESGKMMPEKKTKTNQKHYVDQKTDSKAEKQAGLYKDALDKGALKAGDLEDRREEKVDETLFDDLAWEVECTEDVWKKLRDKHMPPNMRSTIVASIKQLANGEWLPHLQKKLKVPNNLHLYEAKVSKGARVLWELGVAFSPRCSETPEMRLDGKEEGVKHSFICGRIYVEIIRIWDIVLDHDKLFRSVKKIVMSHKRGKSCIIQKKLQSISPSQTQTNNKGRLPVMFSEDVEVDSNSVSEQQHKKIHYFPPASPKETEYNIQKFYSFNSSLVSNVLQNRDIKVNFPFRVTDLEHAIITLKSKAPLLLLGRSGTGKTTCCLYRLWTQFVQYWIIAKEAGAPLLPRTLEYFHHEVKKQAKEDVKQKVKENGLNREAGAKTAGAPVEDETYDHLRQIFITKNAVLCSAVQKNFQDLSHACDIIQDHFKKRTGTLPSRLQDVDELLYPLFLTSRHFLLMLDASIGAPFFFERNKDGSLKGDTPGCTENDGPLSILSLLNEDSDAQEEEGYNDRTDDINDEDEDMHANGTQCNKVDRRCEVTYEVFVNTIWPRIKKKKVSYHPSLVWTEIVSFIKGSFEALYKSCGYLSKEEYIEIGRKRAPNFSGDRERIYEYFVCYERYKRQNSLFDETDLVHHIYNRLRQVQMVPWVIHQIFVDETQDFTQAELCLLVRICQNPNQMFLAGDTAQSIMRGISFRFSDLKSIFFHARQSMQAMVKTGAVEVPKVYYQLTHNYRSHAGILSLASSVLDLLVEFFPESFDQLNKEQGLFHGPQPIVFDSCSFSVLALLLRGNRRKASHIEFGAHQAILVVDEAARDSIPEELRLGLILTIYEAKGLEFDDVLLYNFFKDSQASTEWRVVTSYLEQLRTSRKDFCHADAAIAHESLAVIDEDLLQKKGRPRPLPFDANQHKVLNSELKHLYTALTRARVNLWIFDADNEKRAPMFEYFKARKLVKYLTVEDLYDAKTMFGETSGPSDWIRSGDIFMKHALYEVAAKCFGMARDTVKQNVALAHQRALIASRMKDNPRQMCAEFLKAAELYLECDQPAKAALCLQNARERELAAQVFEKLGQFERAAEIYRRLRLPLASSRCYELAGNFNRAVEVLCENENYDMAIDTLKRYKIKAEEYEQRGEPIPQILVTNKPSDRFCEERLCYNAADMFHKCNNREKMLHALDNLPRWQDKVHFLKERMYLLEAVQIIEENGQAEEAAKFLLVNGKIDDKTFQVLDELKNDPIRSSNAVKDYVHESYQTYKQMPEEKEIATVTQGNIPETENWEDEIEHVVDDPAVKMKSKKLKKRKR